MTSALGGSGWSAPRPGRFTPGKDPVPTVQEAGWAGLDVFEKSRPTGIRSPDRPAHSLSRLSYPAPLERQFFAELFTMQSSSYFELEEL
jgi:hypothetical protein